MSDARRPRGTTRTAEKGATTSSGAAGWVRSVLRAIGGRRTMPTEMDAYRILRHLEDGGMSEVYLGEIRELHKPVAIKFLQQSFEADPVQVRRFGRSARIAALMSHPAITQIHYFGSWHGRPCIVEEFVEGVDLRNWTREHPYLPVEVALLILRDLAGAVQHMHERGVIHRDLKPANILFTRDGALKLTDFGIARREQETTDLTQVGQTPGTPVYMAPEQATGQAADLGPQTDIWALGVISYEMLSGRRPFEASNLLGLHAAITGEPPEDLAVLVPALPPELASTVMRMLEKDVRRRLATAADALVAFEHGLAALDVQNQRLLLRQYVREPVAVSRTLDESRAARRARREGISTQAMGPATGATVPTGPFPSMEEEEDGSEDEADPGTSERVVAWRRLLRPRGAWAAGGVALAIALVLGPLLMTRGHLTRIAELDRGPAASIPPAGPAEGTAKLEESPQAQRPEALEAAPPEPAAKRPAAVAPRVAYGLAPAYPGAGPSGVEEWRQYLAGMLLLPLDPSSLGMPLARPAPEHWFLAPDSGFRHFESNGAGGAMEVSGGRWSLEARNGTTYLVLAYRGGSTEHWILEYRDGHMFANGRPFRVAPRTWPRGEVRSPASRPPPGPRRPRRPPSSGVRGPG